MEKEPIAERNPRILFWSSVNLRKIRQRLDTNAAGPPNRRSPIMMTMPDKKNGEEDP